MHEITIEVTGPAVDGDNFSVRTIRCSPTSPGLVTSTATQDSFYSSMTSKLTLCVCVCVRACVCACVRAYVHVCALYCVFNMSMCTACSRVLCSMGMNQAP